MEPTHKLGEVSEQLKRNIPGFSLIGSNLISFFGDQIYLIALPLVVLSITGSPMQMGIVAALERVAIFVQPLTGVLADRFDRRKILLSCDVGRFLLVGGLGFLVLRDQVSMGIIYTGSLLIGLLTQVYQTSQFATLPRLVHKKDLTAINSLNTGTFHLSVVLAPGLGGLIISFFHPGYALLINSFTFLIGFLILLFIPILSSDDKVANRYSLWTDVKEGALFVFKQKPIFFTNLAMFFSVFGTTLFLTMMIVHLKTMLDFSASEIGWLLSIGGVGAIVGSFLVGSLKKRFSVRSILFTGGSIGGLSIILFSLSDTFWMLAFMNSTGTFAAAMNSVCIVTMRQQLTPDYLLGRVQATSRWMTWTLMPVAALISGVMGEYVGTGITLGIGGAIACLASVIYLHPSLKKA